MKVYRGVLTHYLSEDINNGHFLTSFTSTSINDQIARGFSKDNNKEVIMYHFIVMPGISCIYIGIHEDELLLNPYQCYSFIKKEGSVYLYTIRPISINPPHNENEFLEFKKDIMVRTIEMDGGKAEYHKRMRIISNYRNTHHSKNNRNTQYTKKNKKPKKLSEMEHFKARMNMPIGTSSFSIPLTPEIIADNARIAREYHI